jgi:hypothetical protein
LLSGGFALDMIFRGDPLRFHVYWVAAPVLFFLGLWLLRTDPGPNPRLRRQRWVALWAGLLLLDLWALTLPLVAVRPEDDVLRPSACVEFLGRHRTEGRVLDDDYFDRDGIWIGSPLGQGAPLALVERLESVRGYNPLDVFRYREYLQFCADEDNPLRALEGVYTYPVLGYFPFVNRSLLDLLGVRYRLLPSNELLPDKGWQPVTQDAEPHGYNISSRGGLQTLPPYTVYENQQALPRAFLVPRAQPLPARSEVLRALKNTNFKETVLLEGYTGRSAEAESTRAEASTADFFRPAAMVCYLPNRVELRVEAKASGFLVLTDVWYPGWTCTVDGAATRIHRANYTFRAVVVPAGEHEVVFRFEPAPYRLGKRITFAALAAVPLFFLLLVGLRWRRRRLRSE